MMRIGLFLLTNLAVLVVAGIILSLFGVGSYHGAAGLNIGNLLVICFVFGMVGSAISLFMSKWMAKKTTGTELIDPNAPRNQAEAWLLQEVSQLSQRAGIKMPEVGIFPSYQSNAFATGWNKNDALVAVSTGLLERMNKDELRAVLAHLRVAEAIRLAVLAHNIGGDSDHPHVVEAVLETVRERFRMER